MSDGTITFTASGGGAGASWPPFALVKKKIGLCLGCFDLLHFGHVAHLEAASKLCDELVVVLTPAAWVNKGPGRPIFKEQERIRVLQGLRCVDRVRLGRGPEVAINALRDYQPALYIKGHEYAALDHEGFKAEVAWCRANGIQVVFTCEDTFSSTEALRRLRGE